MRKMWFIIIQKVLMIRETKSLWKHKILNVTFCIYQNGCTIMSTNLYLIDCWNNLFMKVNLNNIAISESAGMGEHK